MENSNLDFVINGKLYLKRGPQIIKSAAYLDALNDNITDMGFDISKENPDFIKLPLLDEYQGLKDMGTSWDGDLDYSGTENFWQLSTEDGASLKLTDCTKKIIITYKSEKDLDKDFVKLSQFLSEATFVGREFKRTKPIINGFGGDDWSYIPFFDDELAHFNKRNIVLYCTQDLFLVKAIDDVFGERYKLINSRYTLDGNYEFFGPVHEEYRDKDKVYAEILQQVTQYNKGRGR